MSRRRAVVLGTAVLAALGVGVALVPAHGQQIHRHSFAGRNTVLVRGDANVRVEEKAHDISTQSFKSQPSSEHIKLTCDAGTGDAAFIHYYYETPPAPITETLTAGVWVKATKPGVQLRARVVFPKEPDPDRPEIRLTTLIVCDSYDRTRSWQKLAITNGPELLGKHLPALQARTGHAVNTADAYIDRLVLNVYAGPGPLEVWVDDLDIGPVTPAPKPAPGVAGTPVKNTRRGELVPQAGTRQVEQRGGQLLIDGKPHFFRAIRHTGTPLYVLRAAGFDSLWLPADASPDLVADVGREGWLVVPAAPPVTPAAVGTGPEVAREAEAFDTFLRKFGNSDVLFWDLGGGLTNEQVGRVELTRSLIQSRDRRRPLGGDLWDGFGAYSNYLDVVGAHRWPLFTSLELASYRDWLAQRRRLTVSSRCVFWTWIQNHLPDWYISTVMERDPQAIEPQGYSEPVGPHPEQVRLLAYIGVATGCRGLGFWSDRSLADSHQGRDRLQGMALLNTELDMLSPVLLAPGVSGERSQWVDTNHPYVKAAIIRGDKGVLVLPIWLGSGNQHVPEQGAVSELKITVPMVPDGADPWRITPAGVECLRGQCQKVNGGTQLTIPEFDLVAPVVFTNDLTSNGLVVWWQDHCRKYGRLAARWALDMAAEEYEKVLAVHQKLTGMGVRVIGAEALLQETHRYYREGQKEFAIELYYRAYLNATRALRPLRVLMRDHWQQAVAGLDLPTASPFAASFFSLPRHWELHAQVQASRVGSSVLPHGGFELSGEIPPTGVRVEALPGWSARAGSLDADRVAVAAGIVRSDKLLDKREAPPKLDLPKTAFSPSRPIVSPDEGYLPPQPELGGSVLKLEVRPVVDLDPSGKPLPRAPVLERTFLAVESPAVRLPPGTLVRVSGWVKVPGEISGTADGVLFYDDAGGEPLAVRVRDTRYKSEPSGSWKHYHLYRRVPASGQISVTMALTGIGVAYFDNIRIEPLYPETTAPTPPPATTPGAGNSNNTVARPTGFRGRTPGVTPASYRPR